MANRKSADSKTKPEGQKPVRAGATTPEATAPLPGPGGGATGKRSENMRAKMPDNDNASRAGGLSPLKKQDLIAQVVERSDVAKKHAKPVIEAMLAVLGDALAQGRDLNLQPLGRIKRKRVKETEKARVIVASIRRPLGASSPAAPPKGVAPDGAEFRNPAAPARHPLKEAVADDRD